MGARLQRPRTGSNGPVVPSQSVQPAIMTICGIGYAKPPVYPDYTSNGSLYEQFGMSYWAVSACSSYLDGQEVLITED